jgi:hypothetical protein
MGFVMNLKLAVVPIHLQRITLQLPRMTMAAVPSMVCHMHSDAPIQTPAGWNLIKLEDKRPFVAPSYELAKNDIRQMLVQKQRFDYVKTLRDKAKVIQ